MANQPDWSLDVGTMALAKVYDLLKVDGIWSIRQSRSFEWWAYRYRQCIEVDPGIDDEGYEIFRLSATTVLVEDVSLSPPEAIAVFDGINKQQSGSTAAVFDPKSRTLFLATVCRVHKENTAWLTPDFSTYAMLQLIDAERIGERAASLLHGRPAHSGHPLEGPRTEPDEMLALGQALSNPPAFGWNNWFSPPELLSAMDLLKQHGLQVHGEQRGFSASIGTAGGGAMALEVRCDPHPILGSGCNLELRIPAKDYADAAHLAAMFNLMESAAKNLRAHLTGAWATVSEPDGTHLLCHSSFLPNILFKQGKLQNLVLSMMLRAQFLKTFLGGGWLIGKSSPGGGH